MRARPRPALENLPRRKPRGLGAVYGERALTVGSAVVGDRRMVRGAGRGGGCRITPTSEVSVGRQVWFEARSGRLRWPGEQPVDRCLIGNRGRIGQGVRTRGCESGPQAQAPHRSGAPRHAAALSLAARTQDRLRRRRELRRPHACPCSSPGSSGARDPDQPPSPRRQPLRPTRGAHRPHPGTTGAEGRAVNKHRNGTPYRRRKGTPLAVRRDGPDAPELSDGAGASGPSLVRFSGFRCGF